MSTVSSSATSGSDILITGFTWYAYFRAFSTLFMGVMCLCCTIYLFTNIYSKNYKNTSGTISFLNTSQQPCGSQDYQQGQCSPYVTYKADDNKNYIEPSNVALASGQPLPPSVNIYYEENNKSSYITGNPNIVPGVFCCVATFFIIISIAQLIFFNYNKSGAAVVGGIELADSFVNRR
jgi:hypothetical protein